MNIKQTDEHNKSKKQYKSDSEKAVHVNVCWRTIGQLRVVERAV